VVLIAELTSGLVVYAAIFGGPRGAKGYVSKGAEPASLCAVLESVGRGKVAICDEALTLLARDMRTRMESAEPLLSDREVAVLQLAADAHRNAAIAAHLGIEVATVKTHLHHAYRKLGVEGRMKATEVARARGIIR